MKCVECGHAMEQKAGTYPYAESGLSHVLLVDVPMYQCPSCHAREAEIPRMEQVASTPGMFDRLATSTHGRGGGTLSQETPWLFAGGIGAGARRHARECRAMGVGVRHSKGSG